MASARAEGDTSETLTKQPEEDSMPARSPEEIHPTFAAAFNAGDESALIELYENEAALMPDPEHVLTGTEQVRAALKQFLALNGRMTAEVKHVVQAGDLALLVAEWSITGSGADGSPVELASRSIEVARRQADGSWRYVIDAPFGRPLTS